LAAGESLGSVEKFTLVAIPQLKEHGAPINARMGLELLAAFAGINGYAQIAGAQPCAKASERVLRALVALTMLNVSPFTTTLRGTPPTVICSPLLGAAVPRELAAGFRAALDILGK